MSRVMLTGATGFVGRHTLLALARAGHDVRAVARRRGPELAGVTWHESDLLAGCEVVGEVEPEILIHLAWYAEHGKFWSSTENVRWVEASLALLRAFAAAGGERAVIAGTCAEYEPSFEVYPESAPQQPETLYGASKHGLHVIASAFAAEVGLSLAWGRLFFLYGPFEQPERFVPSLVLALLRRERARMTEGTQLRDFLHVADAGAAFAALADSALTGPVNIASGQAIKLRELATLIARYTGSLELLDVGGMPRREGEASSIVADVHRLEGEVGWRPRIALEDGVRDTVTWWRERLATPEHDRL
ncbi:MAG TPA: NAD(P)-dependent oxidoreductase [Solirubrobacteraceae bacterium]|nr:NAD(P)-dependent oxidoreductase [Solirubrobacteraceae bacterium]